MDNDMLCNRYREVNRCTRIGNKRVGSWMVLDEKGLTVLLWELS